MIIEAIRDLARKGRKDDPFLIFYAGHGAEVKNSETQTIQAILPYDVNVIDDDTGDKKIVHPIPDTTLAALIADLAEKVGDNITVIFDSCYSGSGTRDGKAPRNLTLDPEYPARFVALGDYCVPNDLDQDILSTASSEILTHEHGGPNSRTHVLLAACKSTELAREHNRRGQFTRVLLKLLKDTPYDELTYAEVIPRLDLLEHQHPQCEGHNIDRHFFGGKALSLRHCYRIQQKDDLFTLNIGELSGICQGTTFDIYLDRHSAEQLSRSIGTAIALSTTQFTTTLELELIDPARPFQLPKGSVALQTKAGIMKKPISKIRVVLNEQHPDVFSAVTKWQDNLNDIRFDSVTPSDHVAPCLELTYSPSGTCLLMNVLDPRALEHDLRNTSHDISASQEKVLAILRAAAHFYYYLDMKPGPEDELCGPKDELEDVQSDITICLNKLEGPKNSRRPIGDNLYSNNLISLVVERSKYGITLTNATSHSLYVYAFYFDFTELSILKLFGRHAGQDHLEPDLRPLDDAPNNTLSIGFGSGNALPINFSVPTDQDVDVGYFKFYFTTQPINLEHVERNGSAFELVEAKGTAFKDDASPRGASLSDDAESVTFWSTIEIPIRLSKK